MKTGWGRRDNLYFPSLYVPHEEDLSRIFRREKAEETLVSFKTIYIGWTLKTSQAFWKASNASIHGGLHMEDSKNYNSKYSLKNSRSFQALFNLVSCLDLQIELESWSNYSDNSKEKNPLTEKKFWGA